MWVTVVGRRQGLEGRMKKPYERKMNISVLDMYKLDKILLSTTVLSGEKAHNAQLI